MSCNINTKNIIHHHTIYGGEERGVPPPLGMRDEGNPSPGGEGRGVHLPARARTRLPHPSPRLPPITIITNMSTITTDSSLH